MTSVEFNTQMDRLIDSYPKGAYPPERIKQIWQAVAEFPQQVFAKIIDELIGSHRQAPLLPEIRTELAKEREKLVQQNRHQSEDYAKVQYLCDYCRGCGVYLCGKKGQNGVWAFRCHCSRGCSDPRKAIPQFKRDHELQGFYHIDIKLNGVA